MHSVTDPDTEPDTDLARRYFDALHQPCQQLKRRRLECIWAPSGNCFNCGRPIPTLLDNQPGTIK